MEDVIGSARRSHFAGTDSTVDVEDIREIDNPLIGIDSRASRSFLLLLYSQELRLFVGNQAVWTMDGDKVQG